MIGYSRVGNPKRVKQAMLIEKLGLEKIGIITHSANLASLFIRKALLNNVNSCNKIAIIEFSPINKDILLETMNDLQNKINLYFFYNLDDAREFSGKIFLVNIASHQKIVNVDFSLRKNIYLVISDKSFLMKKLCMETWRLSFLEPGSYLAKRKDMVVKITVKNNDVIEQEQLNGLLVEAYKQIIDSMTEYGELTIKDAINILVANIGVSKEKAREILNDLQLNRKLRINKGKVELY